MHFFVFTGLESAFIIWPSQSPIDRGWMPCMNALPAGLALSWNSPRNSRARGRRSISLCASRAGFGSNSPLIRASSAHASVLTHSEGSRAPLFRDTRGLIRVCRQAAQWAGWPGWPDQVRPRRENSRGKPESSVCFGALARIQTPPDTPRGRPVRRDRTVLLPAPLGVGLVTRCRSLE